MKNREVIIAGNHKMNMTAAEAAEFVKKLAPLVKGADETVVLCVPYTNIASCVEAAKKTNIKIGAQNVAWADSGAFTGEVSADMLLQLGAGYAVIGHSERRQFFGETDETVNRRTKKALEKGLIPIVCVGEVLEEREKGLTDKIIKQQTEGALNGITKEQAKKVVIAYEPVWAIGTGKTATKEQAQETMSNLRGVVKNMFSSDIASSMPILYGGSMNTKTVDDLMSMSDIDGGLVGGASLVLDDFARIVKYKKEV